MILLRYSEPSLHAPINGAWFHHPSRQHSNHLGNSASSRSQTSGPKTRTNNKTRHEKTPQRDGEKKASLRRLKSFFIEYVSFTRRQQVCGLWPTAYRTDRQGLKYNAASYRHKVWGGEMWKGTFFRLTNHGMGPQHDSINNATVGEMSHLHIRCALSSSASTVVLRNHWKSLELSCPCRSVPTVSSMIVYATVVILVKSFPFVPFFCWGHHSSTDLCNESLLLSYLLCMNKHFYVFTLRSTAIKVSFRLVILF